MIDARGKALPFVALNTFDPNGGTGLFADGANCGRWLRATIGNACATPDGSDVAACVANYGEG